MLDHVLQNHLIDGLLVVRGDLDANHLQMLEKHNTPCAGIEQAELPIDNVSVDNAVGLNQLMAHLLALGYKKITYLATSPTLAAAQQELRYKICSSFLAKHGLPCRVIFGGGWTEQGGHHVVYSDKCEHDEVVFAANDVMAMGAIRALQELGRKVPSDIAVVGFDDIPQAEHTNPPLTTVQQPSYQLGETAVSFILRRLETPELPRQELVLPTQLVVRQSCGTPQ